MGGGLTAHGGGGWAVLDQSSGANSDVVLQRGRSRA